jgi:hypothetical protein
MNNLHMDMPIWVWLYDYGPHTHPEAWADSQSYGNLPDALPQAHTYCFLTEEEARAHPDRMNWGKDHPFTLCKTYLQIGD